MQINGFIPSNFIPEFGLFSKPLYIKFSSLEIPYCDPEIIANKINDFITSYEGLNCNEYNEYKKHWVIEYGSEPMKKIISSLGWENKYENSENYIEKIRQQQNIERKIKAKKWWATMAAHKAIDRFPHNLDCDDDYDEMNEIHLKWTKFEIRFYYDQDKKTIIIEFHKPFREIDDSSYYYFKREIEKIIL
jgi:hypothetical protein